MPSRPNRATVGAATARSEDRRLQQQINDKERVITDLTVQFHEKERVIKDLSVQFQEQRMYLEQQGTLLHTLQGQVQEKDDSLVENAKHLEEKNVELEKAVQLTSELQEQVKELQRTIDDLNKRLGDETIDGNKYTEEISLLKKDLTEKQQSIEAISNEKQTLSKEIEKLTAALQQNAQKKAEEIEKLNTAWQEKHTQEKVEEIEKINAAWQKHLQERDQETEKTIQSWQQHLQEKQQEIDLITKKIEDSKQEDEAKLAPLTSAQEEIEHLKKQLQENQWQIYSSVSTIETLQQQLNERQETINYLQSELDKNMNQMETLNNDLITYQQSNEALAIKDMEISRLNELIIEKDREHDFVIDERERELKNSITEKSQELEQLKKRLAETDDRYEELLSAKDSDLENLRVQLQDSVRKFNEVFEEREELSQDLDAKKIEVTAYIEKINALSEVAEGESGKTEDLQKIIEDQVLKIEELKQELYNKSSDYDALIAELDVPQQDYQMETQQQHQQQQQKKKVTFANEPVTMELPTPPVEENPGDPVSRAELDIALYMLHQRDVRCEELTVELMQLLEERDTLQLRLSNAIREKEEIAAKISPKKTSSAESATSTQSVPSVSTGAVPKSKAILLGATGTELATEVTEHFEDSSKMSNEDLKSKLSQLRSMGYNKDVTIKDDQEARHLQQLSIMQQHRDIASMLPAEAAARLVDANYTLSRDVQSPSKVLLNWLWGRSTPKVNNI